MKWRILTAMLSITTVTAFAGAISGTLAWYEYSTRASLSYEGTSVYNTEQLQIGLITDASINLADRTLFETSADDSASAKSYTLKEGQTSSFSEFIDIDNDGNGTMDRTYWFVNPGAPLTPEIIGNYLYKTGHSTSTTFNYMQPVTTKEHALDTQIDASDFYRTPRFNDNNQSAAEETDYSKIDFAFRVLGSASNTYIKNQDIWLKDAYCQTTGDATDALRVYMEGERKTDSGTETTYTLFNPNYDGNSGSDTVAGVLDLNGDGYYDWSGNYFGNGKELIYGIDNSSIDSSNYHTFTSSDYDGVNSWEYDNINGFENVTETTEKNSFYASHKIGNEGFVDYSTLNLPEAYYSGHSAIYPTDDHGSLSGGKVLTSTSNDDLAIAELSTLIYLEGWNHSIIDKNIGYYYNLGLTFQINRVE